jgi:hypothetical protein
MQAPDGEKGAEGQVLACVPRRRALTAVAQRVTGLRPNPWGFHLPGSRCDMERDDAILNSKDVARILDLSPDTVNEYARKSILPAFKKGRQWRFRRRDIAVFNRQLRGETAA